MESEHLKIHLEECSLLEKALKKGTNWEQDASFLLQNTEHLWNIDIIGEDSTSYLVPSLERQVLSIETAMKAGISLGLEFSMIPKLQDACSILKWCIKALSFSTIIPSCEVIILFSHFTMFKHHMVADCMICFFFLDILFYCALNYIAQSRSRCCVTFL